MNQADLEHLHNQLRVLHVALQDCKAPGAVTARACDALLSVEWLIKKV